MTKQSLVVADDLVVRLDYTLTLSGGEVYDSSEDSGPLEYLQGHGQLIPGLEEALYEMAVGDEKDVIVTPDVAYGEYDPRTGRYSTDGFNGPMKFRNPANLVRVDGRWKVQGPIPRQPGVAWQAILRHATELRDTTTDPAIKRNASRTIAALKRSH